MDGTFSLQKSRARYTMDEERRMLEFLLEQLEDGNSDAWTPYGNKLWEKAARMKITDHSMQSMRDHMRRHLSKKLDNGTAPVDISVRDRIRQKLAEDPSSSKTTTVSSGHVSPVLERSRRAPIAMISDDDDEREQVAHSTPIQRKHQRKQPVPLRVFEDDEGFLANGRPVTPVKRRRVIMGDEVGDQTRSRKCSPNESFKSASAKSPDQRARVTSLMATRNTDDKEIVPVNAENKQVTPANTDDKQVVPVNVDDKQVVPVNADAKQVVAKDTFDKEAFARKVALLQQLSDTYNVPWPTIRNLIKRMRAEKEHIDCMDIEVEVRLLKRKSRKSN